MLAILSAVAALIAGATEIPPQGSGTTRTYAVDGFTSVGLGGADRVRVVVGGRFSVRAEGDPADLAQLVVAKKGDTLDIGRRRGSRGGKAVTVFVTMPRIDAASLGGSGTMAIDRVVATDFAASIGGSGAMTIRSLAARTTKVSIGGSGSLTAAGDAGRAEVSIGGSGSLGSNLAARGAQVSVAGSGSVHLAVHGDAEVNMVGSGDIDLGPASRCSVTRMGSGSVKCGTRR